MVSGLALSCYTACVIVGAINYVNACTCHYPIPVVTVLKIRTLASIRPLARRLTK